MIIILESHLYFQLWLWSEVKIQYHLLVMNRGRGTIFILGRQTVYKKFQTKFLGADLLSKF